ncbi:MFS general substrate transporter [Exidia glandulosa HHB12029]|uniref:MFS general substrate transporter n=1 Tax=Exidia glandulosa HHB12029 TaxID=1314781 RepID=A0A166AGT2_EXIGL|nr:MFS general substrate transporter [Exidia glandulosa HHB12029]
MSVEKRDSSDEKGSIADAYVKQAAPGIHDIPLPDPAVQKRILLKFDFIMLPLLALFYLCNALDKASLGNAKTNGMDKDLHLKGNEYYQLITAFYAPFCVLGTPITILIKRFSAARVLPIMAAGFGGISLLSAAAKNFGGMMTLRILLAVSEAACLPGVVFYLSSFYTRGELARRVGIFYAASSIAGAFGGLIAFGVFSAHTTVLKGWQILFIVEGGFTLLVGLAMFLVLPRSVDTARFLNEEERVVARNRLLHDSSSELGSKLDIKGAFKSLLEWQTLFWIGIELCLGVPLASVSNFLPQVVARLGYSTVKTNLYTVAPNVVGAVCLVLLTQSSDLWRERSMHLITALAVTMVGFVILGAIDVLKHLQVSYFACFLLCMGSFSPSVLTVSWAANNTLDENKRAVLVAIVVAFGNAAGLVSSNVFRAQDEPKYILALVVSACFGGASIVLAAIFGIYMRWDNARRNREQGVNLSARDVDTAILQEGSKHPSFRWMY